MTTRPVPCGLDGPVCGPYNPVMDPLATTPNSDPFPTTIASIPTMIAAYDRVVRANDAVAAVAADTHGEVFYEVVEVAADQLGMHVDFDDPTIRVFEQALSKAVLSYREILRLEIEAR